MKSVTLFALLLAISATASADLISNPLAKSVGASDTETLRLYQRLAGSHWSYHWHGKVGELAFAKDGSIASEMWPGSKWRITGPNTVAIKHPKLGEMPVRFTGEFKKFIAKDWSGGEGVGVWQNPDAKVKK